MQKKSIYIDTSVISALFDTRTPERKSMTDEFWKKIGNYQTFISTITKEEIEASSVQIKKKMLEVVGKFRVLMVNKEIEELTKEYLGNGIASDKYRNDAVHIAIAVVNNLDFIVSWNFKHIVKVKTRRVVNLVNELRGYHPIEIIAPPEL